MGSWRPLLDGALAARARDAASEIVASLRAGACADPTVGAGAAGRAIVEAYAARAGLGDAGLADERLDEAIAGVEREPLDASLFSGFTGVAWAVEHLRGARDPAANDEIDEVLREHVERAPWRGHYDLVSGLVGIGVFARERRRSGARASCAGAVLDRLDELAHRSADGVAWWTPEELAPRTQAVPGGYFDVGVAHGTAGVTAWLGAAAGDGVDRGRAAALLDGAVRWLLARRMGEGEFPLWIGGWPRAGSTGPRPVYRPPGPRAGSAGPRPVSRPPGPERLAPLGWCYGAPGIAAALLHAARATGEPAWKDEAIALARRAATAGEDEVRGGGLCHGRAGLAHILHRLARATSDDELAARARVWFERALALPPEDDASLVSGSAGVALALLGAIGDVEPAWDRLFLLS